MWQGGSDDYFDGLLDLRKTHARPVDAVSGTKADKVVGREDAGEGRGGRMGKCTYNAQVGGNLCIYCGCNAGTHSYPEMYCQPFISRDDETGSVEIPDPPKPPKPDPVNHPQHYTSDPSGVECITITRHRNFNVGNAIKYLWRAGLKWDAAKRSEVEQTVEDLKKARWYIADEIRRLGGDPDK